MSIEGINKYTNTENKNINQCNQIALVDNNKFKVYFIDFGLGFESNRIEDKAVDLHLIKQALEAKHFRYFESFFSNVLKGYKTSKNSSIVLQRLDKVESRGRYKAQF